MRSCLKKTEKSKIAIIVILLFSLVSCGKRTPQPSLIPPPRQVPITVSQKQPQPPPQVDLPQEPKKFEEEQENERIRGFTASLGNIPKYRRTPPKGEKVFPIELNLKDADLVESVRVIGDTLGINYSIDPKVKGKVNVRASGKLYESELLSILETILVVNGATLVKSGKIYEIVPLEKASSKALPVRGRFQPPAGMTAQVVFLDQTQAKELLPALKPLLSPGGSISDASHNSLLVVDYRANIEKILQLIHLIDTRALTQTMVSLIRVKNSNPTELVKELETIFAAYGAMAEKGKFGITFLPVARLNSILIVAGSQPLLSKAAHWVRQLDLESDMLANVHVYHVENYKARNLADLLTQAYGGEVAAAAVRERDVMGAGRGVLPSLTTPGQGLLSPRSLGQGFSTRSGATNPTTSTGTAAEGEGGTPSLTSPQAGGPLASVFPKEQATPARPGAEGTAPKEGIRIIPDEVNNLIIVVAPPHEWKVIHALLKKLDIMPRQVMCEVLFAEIRLTGELQYGVEWFINSRQRISTSAPQPALSLEVLPGAGAAFSTALGGFTFAARDKLNQFRGVINLLAQDGLVNILASPHIMSANNQEAMIHIGEDVPILTSQAVPLVSQETSFQTQTVQYRSSGIILVVKPQINAKGLITLDIVQEVSTPVQTTTGVTSTPTFTIRTARTSLITADNQSIVLGGLIRDDKFRGSSGIPGVRKVPILGPLFGTESSRTERTELIVLITPQLVGDLVDSAHITHTVRERIQPEGPRPPENRKPQPPVPPGPREW